MFITATLPISLLNILEDKFDIIGNNRVIRGSSNRSNISYKRIYYKTKEEELLEINRVIKEIERRDTNVENKVLIFVSSIKVGNKLKDLLNLDFIYSTLKDKDTLLNSFLNRNTNRVLITTSILEVGLDLKNIRYTINIDPIFSLISIVQSSGRIRSGGISFIITKEPTRYNKEEIERNLILKDNNTIKNLIQFKELDLAYYKRLTIENNCLRIPISLFLDNSYYKCSNIDNKCSICLEKDDILKGIKEKEEVTFRNNNFKLLKLEERLIDYYNNYCFYCLIDIYNKTSSYKHSLKNCPNIKNNTTLIDIIEKVKKYIKLNSLIKSNSACFKCLLPNNICNKLRNEYNIANNNCYFNNFIFNLIGILYNFKEYLDFLLKDKLLSSSLEIFTKSLIEPITIGTLKTIYIIDLINKINIVKFIKDLEGNNLESSSNSFLEEDYSINNNLEDINIDSSINTNNNLKVSNLNTSTNINNNLEDTTINLESNRIENNKTRGITLNSYLNRIEDLNIEDFFISNTNKYNRNVSGTNLNRIEEKTKVRTKSKGKTKEVNKCLDIGINRDRIEEIEDFDNLDFNTTFKYNLELAKANSLEDIRDNNIYKTTNTNLEEESSTKRD